MYEFMNNEIGTFLSTCSLQTTDERRHFVYESRNLFDDLQAHNHTQQHHTAKKMDYKRKYPEGEFTKLEIFFLLQNSFSNFNIFFPPNPQFPFELFIQQRFEIKSCMI